jgi:DNA-binding response OmpR family regulator
MEARRMPPAEEQQTSPAESDFRLVPERSAVRVAGREVVLTDRQFRLVAVLVGEPGRTFSRAELVARAFDAPAQERTVDVHVREIRRKLDPDGGLIETVRGRGYRYGAAAGGTRPA